MKGTLEFMSIKTEKWELLELEEWEAIIKNCKNDGTKPSDILLEMGFDINKIYDGETVLISLCKENFFELVEPLIKSGVDVNMANNKGETALMWACIKGNKDIVKLLLDNGANVQRQGDAFSCLFHAIVKGDIQIVKLLLGI